MTTTDHNVWARGATTSVVAPDTAPPAPPTYYPPTTEGGQPSPGGPRRKLPRWIATTAVIVAIGGAGVGGWALRGTQSPAATPATPSASPTAAAPTLTAEQAKQQTCGAYKTLGTQWSAAYQKWLAALPQPWAWTDPAVKSATAEFDATATQVASQLAQLTAPGTPADVAATVRDVRLKIVDLAASHGQTGTGAETDAKIDAVDTAMAAANKVCGI
ncbi:hypothetical protein VXE65_20415 [Mycolicibacterium conceptionense]|uniref:hypothetical protein n=1 Tax=Mycolicibacterium conceptionense TaxID=451644 RepID=UPI0032049969